jgi:hypothetical protein
MSDPYCGIGEIPKGYRRGSMKECAERGQIRYYGIKKIDSTTLETAKVKKESPKIILGKLIALDGKAKRLVREYKHEKDPDKKEKIKQQVKKIEEKMKQLRKQKEILEKRQQNRTKNIKTKVNKLTGKTKRNSKTKK